MSDETLEAMANQQAQSAQEGNPFAQAAGQQERAQTQYYLNITLEVAEGVEIRMPLNCPVAEDIAGMSANQKALMKLLKDKADAAEKSGNPEDLVVNCKVTASMFKRGSTAPETGGWSL